MFRAIWPLALAAAADGRAAAVLAETRRGNVTVARPNRGVLGYADAVLAGRRGGGDRAAALAAAADADLGDGSFGHLSRLLAAGPALTDGWGEPARWLDGGARRLRRQGLRRPRRLVRGAALGAGAGPARPGSGSRRARPRSSGWSPPAWPTRRSPPGCACRPGPWKSTSRACCARPARRRARCSSRSPARGRSPQPATPPRYVAGGYVVSPMPPPSGGSTIPVTARARRTRHDTGSEEPRPARR